MFQTFPNWPWRRLKAYIDWAKGFCEIVICESGGKKVVREILSGLNRHMDRSIRLP
jgi:hypothetical protein